MVKFVLPPESPQDAAKPVKTRNLRQLIIYAFYILLVVLALVGLWYAQSGGALSLSY